MDIVIKEYLPKTKKLRPKSSSIELFQELYLCSALQALRAEYANGANQGDGGFWQELSHSHVKAR